MLGRGGPYGLPKPRSRERLGCLVVLVQPVRGTQLSSAYYGSVAPSYLKWRRVGDEHLAWDIKTEATVLQAAFYDAALENGTLAAARLA